MPNLGPSGWAESNWRTGETGKMLGNTENAPGSNGEPNRILVTGNLSRAEAKMRTPRIAILFNLKNSTSLSGRIKWMTAERAGMLDGVPLPMMLARTT
mgnify:CR=1 FL=1